MTEIRRLRGLWPLLNMNDEPTKKIPMRTLKEIAQNILDSTAASSKTFATLVEVKNLDLNDKEVTGGEHWVNETNIENDETIDKTIIPILKSLIYSVNNSKVLTPRMSEKEAENQEHAFPSYSVNIKLKLPEELMRSVVALIPKELWPRNNDHTVDLLKRIRQDITDFFDWINVFTGGETTYPPKCNLQGKNEDGKGLLTNLNACPNSKQPKRRSLSVVVKDKRTYAGNNDGEGQGEEVWRLFNYTSCQRRPDDWRGRPMEREWFDLGLHVWAACWHHLTPASRRGPPTHVQVLFYYTALDSTMNHHRDNSCSGDIQRIANGGQLGGAGHASAGATNSQM